MQRSFSTVQWKLTYVSSKPWLTCYLIKLNSWCLGHRKEELQDRCVSNAGGRGLGVLGLLVTSDRNPIWTRRIEGEKILVQKIQRRFEGPNWEKGKDPALLRSAQKQEHKSSLHLSFSAFLYKTVPFLTAHQSLPHGRKQRPPKSSSELYNLSPEPPKRNWLSSSFQFENFSGKDCDWPRLSQCRPWANLLWNGSHSACT